MSDRVPSPLPELRKRLREGVQALKLPLLPVLTVNLADATVIGQKHRTLLVALGAAGIPQPISTEPLEVRDAQLLAGPQADGVTPNAGDVFVAPNNNPLPTGWPLGPREWVGTGPTDLSEWYMVGANAGDVLRILLTE